MAYPHCVKDRAYQIDPDCWVSYSGKPATFKSAIEKRRNASLSQANEEYEAARPLRLAGMSLIDQIDEIANIDDVKAVLHRMTEEAT